MATPAATWALITRSCRHPEPVRIAGLHAHRARITDELRAEVCSACAGWPTVPVADRVITYDLRAPGTYPVPS